MKFILSVVFTLNILGLVVTAQSPPPPPPPPLIYKAPEKTILQEFVSSNKDFKAIFPGTPQIKEEKLENGSFTMYRIYRQGSNSIVNVSESVTDIEKQKDKVYEMARANFLKEPRTKIESEKDVSNSGITGKEFSVTDNFTYRKVRFFITGKKVYEIINDVTNWHVIGEKTKKEYFDETDRFFDSFKILK